MTEDDLRQIEAIVRSIVSESKTGAFRDRIGNFTRTIYANRQYPDCLWYFWNGGEKVHEPIATPVLTGRITNFQIMEKEFRGRSDDKIQIEMMTTEGRFNVETGFETVVGRGWMIALLMLSPKEGDLISLKVRPGDQDEKALLGSLYNSEEREVFKPYTKEENWKCVADRLIAMFPRGRYYSLADQARDRKDKEEGRTSGSVDAMPTPPASPWAKLKDVYDRAEIVEVLWELYGVEDPNKISSDKRSEALEAVSNALRTRAALTDDEPF